MKNYIILPTLNEKDNIGPLIKILLNYDSHIVVVDDDSQDGTQETVEAMARHCDRIHLIKRKGRKGRGISGIEGFRFALERGADTVVEMDADFSHIPFYVPHLLEAVKNYDLVLGSRFVKGGRDKRKCFFRKLLTRAANLYIRQLLGLPYLDCTSGFRCFRAEVLNNLNLEKIVSSGPSITFEILYRAHRAGYWIREIPIVFRDRYQGTSSLNFGILLRCFFTVISLRLQRNR